MRTVFMLERLSFIAALDTNTSLAFSVDVKLVDEVPVGKRLASKRE